MHFVTFIPANDANGACLFTDFITLPGIEPGACSIRSKCPQWLVYLPLMPEAQCLIPGSDDTISESEHISLASFARMITTNGNVLLIGTLTGGALCRLKTPTIIK